MRGEADRKELGWRDKNERKQPGREMISRRYGREKEKERERRGYDGTTKGDMRERKRENDSQGPHKLEHSQAKSKPPLCLCLSAKASLNKEADTGGGKL